MLHMKRTEQAAEALAEALVAAVTLTKVSLAQCQHYQRPEGDEFYLSKQELQTKQLPVYQK